MKKLAYLSALGTLVVSLGCNKNSDSGAGGTADTTTRSSSSATGGSVDTQTTQTSTRSRDTADTGTSPDNTRLNARDRSGDTLTPGDQAENQQDLEITRRIRRAITSDDQLSQDAKNIKIVTANGKVTLRGPVKNEQERKAIESIAQQTQGATVDNQLEVKGTNQ